LKVPLLSLTTSMQNQTMKNPMASSNRSSKLSIHTPSTSKARGKAMLMPLKATA
jgi:hypothetical protein